MTEFKQDNFTFVDVVSLIFLVILFIGNFFGLLYFTSGNFPISIAISALVVVLYYAIIQLLKKSKQKMVTQRYKSPATILLVLFVVLAIFSVIFIGACGKNKVDKKEVIEKFIAASENMKSGDMLINMKMVQNLNGNKTNMDMTIDASIIQEPLAMRMEIAMPSQNVKMTSFIKDNIILCEIFQMPNWHSL